MKHSKLQPNYFWLYFNLFATRRPEGFTRAAVAMEKGI